MADPVQLPLRLVMPDYATWDQVYSRSEDLVVPQLKAFVIGQGEDFILLHSKEGSGKTLLLQTVCQEAQKIGQDAVYLSLAEVGHYAPAWLHDLQHHDVVCLDAVDTIAGQAEWEQALFHLFNAMRDQNKRLLLAMRRSLAQASWCLADLTSRLQWGLLLQLPPLSEREIIQALQQKAQQVGLVLTDDIAEFMLRRLPRKMDELSQALQQLNHASLVAQRKLTVPFVKDVLHI